jgi:hypothetical protein
MTHKRNWQQYNRQLVSRGSCLLYIDPELVHQWVVQSGHRGRPAFHLRVIELALTLREAYGMPLRAAQGFLRSLIKLMGLSLKEPDYTLLCKRARELNKCLRHWAGQPKCIVVDSTGLKIYGQGEWRRNRYRLSRHQKWIKFHLGIDADTQQIIACFATDDRTIDAQAVSQLMADAPLSLELAIGDGAYDREASRKYFHGRGMRTLIPPRHDALLDDQPFKAERNVIICQMMEHGDRKEGRRLWKQQSGYHRRSRVEAAISRAKRQFGDRLTARRSDNQLAQLVLRCNVMNRMRALTSAN